MSAFDLRAVVRVAGMALLMSAAAHAQVLPPPGPESVPGGPGLAAQDGDDSLDVLTRGPIHEAFAEQYNADPAGGLVITKAPPEPIDEIAPETIPEGNNIQWMSGYWGWDDERQDFIWISGLWRDVPPGQRWVPGYWNPAEGGYQWVSGFWTGTESAELDYQPDGPPATLEQGPNIEAPSDSQFWVPGVWTYADTGYRWRAGYWAPAYDDWVWVPDRWVWTPYGFVFCPGYHDYRLPVRAVAFAPVYFTHVHWWHHHRRPYCPSVVLDCGPLTMHWFVRPNYCHYYFGDYYADTYYTGWGLQPWHTCSVGFGGYGGWRNRHCHYDPLFTFYSGYHRRHHHVDFGDRMHRWHNHYVAHADDRPRWTKRDQDNFDDAMRKAGRVRGDGKQNRIGRDFNEFVKNPTEHNQKFVRLDERQRDRHTKVGKETVQLATLRHDIESDGGKIRGVRGDGKKDGGNRNGETTGLPGSNGSDGNSGGNNDNKGNGGRGPRKLKLPTDQGAGDQAVVTQDGNREPNRKKGRIKPPDGPPGGNGGIVSTDGNNGGNNGGNNKSGGNNSRRGRGQELTDGNQGQNGNNNNNTVNNGNANGNGDSSRRGRGSNKDNKGGSNGTLPGLGGGDVQVPDTGAGNNNDSSRSRGRSKGNDSGNQGLNPSQGNPSGGTNSSGDGNKGSNRDRTPRRGNSGDGSNGGNNSGNNSGLGGSNPNFKNQPPSGGGGNNGNNNGNNSNGGRSRSRGSFDSNPNGGGNSGGNNAGNNGNSGGNNKNQRGSGGSNGKGSGSGVGNSSSGSGGSLGSGGGGGSSRRNQGNSNGSGGNNGGNKKKKD